MQYLQIAKISDDSQKKVCVIYIFIVIMIIHAIEAYILNPVFMAGKTEFATFYTFVVLIVGEHFWEPGLIVGG